MLSFYIWDDGIKWVNFKLFELEVTSLKHFPETLKEEITKI